MKHIINTFFILLSGALFAQTSVLKNSVPKDLHKHTLLVERFKPLNPNDKYFKSGDIDKKKQQHFINKHNKNISKNNQKLEKLFAKLYEHKYIMSDFDSKLDTNVYPYMFSRTLILASKLSTKNVEKGFFTFSHNIENRKNNKSMRDINLYSRRYWHNVKIIIHEINDYLEGKK